MTDHFDYRVDSIRSLTPNLVQVFLRPQESKNLCYRAGQYLEILYPNNTWQPFSIANAPDNLGRIELHIRHLRSDALTAALLQQLQNSHHATIRGPFGHAYYRPAPDCPVVLVAGGTGFAYIKALLEAAIAQNDQRRLHLFWGVKNPEDFYLPDLTPRWLEQLKEFRHDLIVSQPKDNVWQGKTGYVYNAVLTEYPDMASLQVYASGPLQMIRDSFNLFKQRGLNAALMFSDML